MKKLLALLVVFLMASTASVAIAARVPGGEYGENMLYENLDTKDGINTSVTVAGAGSSGSTTDNAPHIKWKWELVEDLDGNGGALVNEDTENNHLSVDLNPYGTRTVHYFAVVRKGTYNIENVYADVWHPDGTYKYQVRLNILDLDGGIDAWNYVTTNYPEVLKDNITESYTDTLLQLQEEESFVYEGSANLSYCQPGGWYAVAARAEDSHGTWSCPLWNYFWYIPTASMDIDFTSVNYGSAPTGEWQMRGGDYDFSTAEKPTVRNTGNVPLDFSFLQDDMDFWKTDGQWNVKYKARLGTATNGNETAEYFPDQESERVGTLDLCVEDKFDFFIYIIKGTSGEQYTGTMTVFAHTDSLYGHYSVNEDTRATWGVDAHPTGSTPNGLPTAPGAGFEP